MECCQDYVTIALEHGFCSIPQLQGYAPWGDFSASGKPIDNWWGGEQKQRTEGVKLAQSKFIGKKQQVDPHHGLLGRI